MSKISGQFLISGQFQDSCEISRIPGNWEPCNNATAVMSLRRHSNDKHHTVI